MTWRGWRAWQADVVPSTTAPARTLPAPVARRASLAVLLVATVAFVVVASLLVPWEWVPGGRPATVRPDELLTPEQVERAEAFATVQRWIGWGNLALSLLVALGLGLTRTGSRLVARLRGPWRWRVVLGSLGVVLAGAVATLPLRLVARARAVEAGLSTQALPGWLRDWGVSTAVSWVYAAVVVLLVVGLARRLPRTWPAAFGLSAATLVVAGSWAYPVVVEPLFNSFEPLPAGELRSQVMTLAEQEGVPVSEVLVADASRRTTTLNAWVSGLGSTRRVVLYDTLVDDVPRREALVIVAHELAHAREHDVALGTGLGALGVGAGAGALGLLLGWGGLLRRAGAAGAASPEVVPLVLALVAIGTLLASPVENTVSRAIEARADRVALEFTQDPEAFEAMQVRLAARSLADPRPPTWSQLWFGSHPTLVQRVGIARAVEPR